MCAMTYPAHWPRPYKYTDSTHRATRRNSLLSLITEEDKIALYQRRITTRALALKYKVTECYVSKLFPGKAPIEETTRDRVKAKKDLHIVRRQFRATLVVRVLAGELSTAQAADAARISYRSMARAVKEGRLAKEKGMV